MVIKFIEFFKHFQNSKKKIYLCNLNQLTQKFCSWVCLRLKLKILVNFCYFLERFHSLSKELLTELKCKIGKIVKIKTCLVATYGNLKTYDILPVERFKDEFGSWSFDPLCGQMKIIVELENGECFPKNWKLSENVSFEKLKNERCEEILDCLFSLLLRRFDCIRQSFSSNEVNLKNIDMFNLSNTIETS